MSIFHQIHYNAMDEKGRVVIPATFRRDAPPEILAGEFHITPEKDGHLIVRPKPEWERFLNRIRRASVKSSVKAEYIKIMNALSQKTSLDRQNRLVMSPQLRRKMDIAPEDGRVELAIVGAGDYFEIWRSDRFEGEDAMLDKAALLLDEIDSVIDDEF